jgi:phage host-nuclease inhibitor protein Gam
MTTRIKKSAAAVPTPVSRADMENLVGQIAALKREEADQKLRMDKLIAKVKADFEESLAKVADDLKPLIIAAENWATSNSFQFGGNKSIKMLHGTVGFRTGNPTLAPLNKKWNREKITKAVCQYLPNFIRDTPTVDKEAILAQRKDEAIVAVMPLCGMRVTQDESFFVEPVMTTVEKRETA